MKKVIVKTECDEETSFYVSQGVESITVDGEEWVKKTDAEKKENITVEFETSEDNDVITYDADCAFLAIFIDGTKIYANSDGRIEYLGYNSSDWKILQSS